MTKVGLINHEPLTILVSDQFNYQKLKHWSRCNGCLILTKLVWYVGTMHFVGWLLGAHEFEGSYLLLSRFESASVPVLQICSLVPNIMSCFVFVTYSQNLLWNFAVGAYLVFEIEMYFDATKECLPVKSHKWCME